MAEPIVFQDKEKIYYADSCEPLKAAERRNELYLRGWARGNYPGVQLPRDMLPQLRSIGVWDATRPQTWGLDLHCNEGIEFTYMARGKTAFEVDGESSLLRKGDLTITRPWQFHRVGKPNIGASRLIWVIIDVDVRRPNQPWQWPDWLICTPKDLQRLTDLLRHNEQPVWQADDEVARAFAKLDGLLDAGNPGECQTRLTLVLNELIVALMEMLEGQRIPLNEHLSTTRRMVEMFLDELPKHLAIRWTLDKMAGECGLSRSQFSSYCKQIANMTPIEFLTACRVSAAEKMLTAEPDLTITDIAYASGFSSSQYFATAFRKYTGCTPTAFRCESAEAHGLSPDASPGGPARPA
jgi:AraC-like DNA-binding protein